MSQNLEQDDDLKRLDEHLTRHGLVRKGMPKDGACLFRCVSEVLHGTQMNHSRVRKACVEFMELNPDEFSPFVDAEECDSYEQYLKRMLDETAWGSQIELQALSRRFDIDFDIYTDDQSCSLLTVHNGGQKKVILAYSSGNHYDLVYPKAEFDALTVAQSIMMAILEAAQARMLGSTRHVGYPIPRNYKYDNIGLRLWQSEVNKQNKKDRKIARKLQDFAESEPSGPAAASPEEAPASPANDTVIQSSPVSNSNAIQPDKAVEDSEELRRSIDQLEQEKSDAALAAALQAEEDANALAEEDESSEPQQFQGQGKRKKKATKKKAQQQNQQKQKQQQPQHRADPSKTDQSPIADQPPFRGVDGSSKGERAVETSASPEIPRVEVPAKKGTGFRYRPKDEPEPSVAGPVAPAVPPADSSSQPISAEDVQQKQIPAKVKPQKQPSPPTPPFVLADARQAYLAAHPPPPEFSGGVIYPRPMQIPSHFAISQPAHRTYGAGVSQHFFPAVQTPQMAEYYGRMYMALSQQQMQAQRQAHSPMFASSPSFDTARPKPPQASTQDNTAAVYPANPCFYS